MRMFARTAYAIALAAMPLALPAQIIPTLALKSGTVAFDAHATLGAFTGATSTLTGSLVGAPGIDGVRGWVEAPSASLVTHNDHRDRDMATSMEFSKYPTIRFDLGQVSVGSQMGDSIAVTLRGRFTVHGQTHDADVPGWVWVHAGTVHFKGATPLDVKDYGVGGLSKALGMLKMNSKIVVRVDVLF
jgi:polyisoprenoid-binding protein YceI